MTPPRKRNENPKTKDRKNLSNTQVIRFLPGAGNHTFLAPPQHFSGGKQTGKKKFRRKNLITYLSFSSANQKKSNKIQKMRRKFHAHLSP